MSFSRYAPEDSVISSETVVRGLWSGDSNTFQPSFTNTSSYGEYFLNVYDGSPSVSSSTVQYSIQYGNISGSGSLPINPAVSSSSPSRIIYGEYRNLVYGTETVNFSFNSDITSSKDIFVINMARNRYKESLLPGSFSLALSFPSASVTNSIRLIDEIALNVIDVVEGFCHVIFKNFHQMSVLNLRLRFLIGVKYGKRIDWFLFKFQA